MNLKSQQIDKVQNLFQQAIAGVDLYLNGLKQEPYLFTDEAELLKVRYFLVKMKEAVDSYRMDVLPINFVRMLETWPYQNDVRKVISEAEYQYEKLQKKVEKERRS